MAPLSKEEENYIRLTLLVIDVSQRAVRTYFDSEFPPKRLPSMLIANYTTINELKRNKTLKPVQLDLLNPKNGMFCIIADI